MSSEIWRGYAPVEVRISCGEETHRVRWEDGELHALDHDDADGERTLHALGGDRSECIAVVDGWAKHCADPRVLVLASRGATDRLAPAPDRAVTGLGGWFAAPTMMQMGNARARRAALRRMAMMRGGAMNAGMVGVGGGSHTVMTSHGVMSSNTAVRVGGAGGDAAFDYDIHALLSLGALGPRLVATVIAHWDRLLAEDAPEARARHGALVAALFGRVTYALREWSGDAQLELPLEMIHAAQNPRITHDGIAVPFRWLLDVWDRGLAVVAGRFTLQAEAGGTSLLTVGAIGEPPRRMTITLE